MKQVRHFLTAGCLMFIALQGGNAFAQTATSSLQVPSVPPNLVVPEGNHLVLKGRAAGSQNYVCTLVGSAPTWMFVGPQATLFVDLSWPIQQSRQVATHFFSSNPEEAGTTRPTWQSSMDSSRVWGNAIETSTDPQYVAPGAIPWLLVKAVGTQYGDNYGTILSLTTYIQRVNTSGGMAPSTPCDESSFGQLVLVPYTADYYFYRANRK